MKVVAQLLALFIAVSIESSWGAMHLTQSGEGEVLIFPLYSAFGSDTTEVSITNPTGVVKAVRVNVREGLNGQLGLNWNLYLGPYDTFTFEVRPDPEGAGALINPVASELTCTVPRFPRSGGAAYEGIYMRNRLWEEDSFSGFERSLSGYVEVIELGQWDPFNGVKGPAAARGASGSYADCSTLVDAWSKGYYPEEWVGDWQANPADEALPWQGGGLRGSALIRSSSASLRYDALGIAEFARYQFSAEYHVTPGDYTSPSLNSGSIYYEQTIGGSVVNQVAKEGRDAVSALLSKTIIQSNAPALQNSVQSWIVSYPTKHLHTKYSSWLGPFSEIWDSSLSRACDYVELGVYSPSDDRFEKIDDMELCGVVNLVNTSRYGQAPFSLPHWVTTSAQTGANIQLNAMRSGYRSAGSTSFDRSITTETKYDADTRIIGIPMVAIPVYFNTVGDTKLGAFEASTLRIYERIATSFQSASYSAETAAVTLSTVNLSGLDVIGHEILCRAAKGALEASGESASPPFSPAPPISVQVSPLVNGEQYSCEAFAKTDSGRGEISATFVLQSLVPSAPTVSGYDYGDGEIIVFASSSSDGGYPITSYTAVCTDGTNDYTGTSSSSPVTVTGLTNDVPYTCTVTATNAVGTSSASAATDPITPEALSMGLPIWLLYQATQ